MPELRLQAGRPTRNAGLDTTSGISSLVPARMGRYRNLMELVRQIRDYNADASKAISNVLRLANSGWEIQVTKLDGETPDPEGQALVDALVEEGVAREYGGGLNVLINMLLLTAATQGALAMEIEIGEPIEVYDFVVVNPWSIDFRRDEMGHWVPGIQHLGQFNPLSPLQFRYIPLDPEPGEPRGRSPFWAALDVVFFQMEVLRDLKAAAHFAGYPRVDISVAFEAVLKVVQDTRPDLLQPDKADDLRSFLDGYLSDISGMVDDLEPDDAFIHYDSVESTYTVPSGKTIDIRELVETIDAQIVSGLKQLPVLLGRNDAATTTHATVQWQVFVQELKAFQRVVSRMLEWALGMALRVWGRQGLVQVTFEELRTSDRVQDATAESIETRTKLTQVAAGFITADEAAQELVGHDAVAAMGYWIESGDLIDGVSPSEPEDGQENAVELRVGRSHRREVEDISRLPWWQQALYQEAETTCWNTYRAQLRAAWRRMGE